MMVAQQKAKRLLMQIFCNGRKSYSLPIVPGDRFSKTCFNAYLPNIHREKKGKNHVNRGTFNPPAGRETAPLFTAFR